MAADKLQGRLGNGGLRGTEKMSENGMSLPQPLIGTGTPKADGVEGVLKGCCTEQASAMLRGRGKALGEISGELPGVFLLPVGWVSQVQPLFLLPDSLKRMCVKGISALLRTM